MSDDERSPGPPNDLAVCRELLALLESESDNREYWGAPATAQLDALRGLIAYIERWWEERESPCLSRCKWIDGKNVKQIAALQDEVARLRRILSGIETFAHHA